MKRALYIGRFQPFHNGHLRAVEFIDENYDYDEIMIVVGNNLSSHEEENPMTLGERIEMIESVFKPFRLDDKVSVRGISDIQHNHVWVGHVTSQIPKFDAVFTNNPTVEILFEDSPYDYDLFDIDMHQREVYRGSTIREAITNEFNWEHAVPTSVSEFMIENKLDRRIRKLNKKDYK